MVSTHLAPLPGDPTSLKNVAVRYQSVAEAIMASATKLDALSHHGSVGKSVEQLRADAHGTASHIRTAQPRYNETAIALFEFAVKLTDAQAQANSAISTVSSQNDHLSNLKYVRRSREEDRIAAYANPERQDEEDAISREIRNIDSQIDQAHHRISVATNDYNSAELDRDRAVKAAIARINPVLNELNDRARDYVRAAVEAVQDFVAMVAKWIDEVLLPIIAAILVVIAAIVLILVALALLLVLLNIIALIVMVTWPILVMIALIIVDYLKYAIEKEKNAPTPEMIRVPRPQHKGTDQAPVDRGNYENTLAENALLDGWGGRDSTFVEVIKVVGEDGVTRWRVILPSTQDWEWLSGFVGGDWANLNDQGALNGLSADAILMLFPELQTAYERAVRDSMLQAGIQPNDPVMISGWSLGGIVAGKLAADTNDQFNVQAIFVAGSPIDNLNIPPSVSVISIQHHGDVVPMTDLTPGRNSDHWVTISEDPPAGKSAHSADSYGETARNYVDGKAGDPRIDNIREHQSDFYSKNEERFLYEGQEKR